MYTIILLTALAAYAEGDSEDRSAPVGQEAERRDEVSRIAQAKVRRLNITVAKDQPATAQLQPKSLLSWSNPTVGAIYGEVFLWAAADRPVAIGSVYHRYDSGWGWNLELVSTCESPLRAEEEQKTLWDSPTAGIEFRPIPDAPLPAPKPAARLSQMRKLAERFSTELADGRTAEDVNRQLRLLSQPLYRYSSEADNVIDGAIFAVVEATDPELWIFLEGVSEPENAQWRYALARMDSWPMQVRLDGKVVQTWEKIEKPWANRKATYTLVPFPPDVAATEP